MFSKRHKRSIPQPPLTRERKSWLQHRSRFILLVSFLLLGFIGLLWRMVNLNITNHAFLQAQSDARTLREINIPAYRGMIMDREGNPLAISTPMDSVWLNPQKFAATPQQVKQLAYWLQIPVSRIQHQVASKHLGREFIYLERRVNPDLVAHIKKLKIPGVYFQREYRRYYPEGAMMAHVIGLTNVDDQGQEGLELTFNDWLNGVPGRERVVKDRLGQVVSVLNTVRKPKPGKDLMLSLDKRIQFLAFHYLQQGITENKAKSGSVIVLDVATGEVLAMANWPIYNPNQRPKSHDERFRNRAVTDVFEPGSTVKPFSVINALISGKYTADTKIDTSPGWMILNGHRVEDEHNNKVLTVTEVLQLSSNVGITKLTLSLPPEQLWQLLKKVGYGQSTESGFPGESVGTLENHPTWQPFTLATFSFGYGLSVTALQLARAYSVIAADGVRRPISFLKTDKPPVGERVIPANIAQQIRSILEAVTKPGGTAPRASIPGYRVCGKTGTVRIVGANGYEKHHHTAIFVGMAPADNPKLVVAVVVNEPSAQYYYGGLVSAPIFSEVMRGALRLLSIPPSSSA